MLVVRPFDVCEPYFGLCTNFGCFSLNVKNRSKYLFEVRFYHPYYYLNPWD